MNSKVKYKVEDKLLERLLQKQPYNSMLLRYDFPQYGIEYKPAIENLKYFKLIKSNRHEKEITFSLTEKGYDAVEMGFYNWVKQKIGNDWDDGKFNLSSNPKTIEVRAWKEYMSEKSSQINLELKGERNVSKNEELEETKYEKFRAWCNRNHKVIAVIMGFITVGVAIIGLLTN